MRSHLVALFRNLYAGLLLSLRLRPPLGGFVVSLDQAALLIVGNVLLALLWTGWQADAPSAFSVYGLSDAAFVLTSVMMVGYLAGKWLRQESLVLPLVIAIYSVAPFLFLLWQGLEVWWRSEVVFEDDARFVFSVAAYFGWVLIVAWAAFAHLLGRRWLRAAIPALLYASLVMGPSYYLGAPQYWQVVLEDETPTQGTDTAQLNVEDVFYAQYDQMRSAVADLLPERPGVVDLYFLGFGGFAAQDVFMKEVKYAQALFDNRFDTAGRSLVLVNNVATLPQDPIASSNNLREALRQIGHHMNREEDILFLFITSHGNEDQRIAVSFGGMPLNEIEPQMLKTFLDDAGIRWRVLMVSACYSGGFLEPFQDGFTVIATAAAADRTSFGCAAEESFTYFGEAVLEQQLARSDSFVQAFEAAARSIAEREEAEGLTPSLPQLHVGAEIARKLAQWHGGLQAPAMRRACGERLSETSC
jgi:hypothetical protein